MSKKWIFLTSVLSLGSAGTLQAHPLDSPDIVYIDGVACNRACQSYMAWSRQILSASGQPAPAQLPQRSANGVVHRTAAAGALRSKPSAPAGMATRGYRIPREPPQAKVAAVQPADAAQPPSPMSCQTRLTAPPAPVPEQYKSRSAPRWPLRST